MAMTQTQSMKLQLELSSIQHAKLKFEYQIMERLDDIARIKKSLVVQDAAIADKLAEIDGAEKE